MALKSAIEMVKFNDGIATNALGAGSAVQEMLKSMKSIEAATVPSSMRMLREMHRGFEGLTRVLNNADLVYWLNASTSQQYTQAFCKYLSTCGLINSDGSTKKSWDTYRNWALQLQTQGA